MIITITPNEIINRCLWSNYQRFVLERKGLKDDDIKTILEEDKSLVLSENDAYVIGLLKVVETTNFVHRFKQHINEVLEIRSTIESIKSLDKKKEEVVEDFVVIKKSIVLEECFEFKNRFPSYYKGDRSFQENVKKLYEFINNKIKEINELESITVMKNMKNKVFEVDYLLSDKIESLFNLSIDD